MPVCESRKRCHWPDSLTLRVHYRFKRRDRLQVSQDGAGHVRMDDVDDVDDSLRATNGNLPHTDGGYTNLHSDDPVYDGFTTVVCDPGYFWPRSTVEHGVLRCDADTGRIWTRCILKQCYNDQNAQIFYGPSVPVAAPALRPEGSSSQDAGAQERFWAVGSPGGGPPHEIAGTGSGGNSGPTSSRDDGDSQHGTPILGNTLFPQDAEYVYKHQWREATDLSGRQRFIIGARSPIYCAEDLGYYTSLAAAGAPGRDDWLHRGVRYSRHREGVEMLGPRIPIYDLCGPPVVKPLPKDGNSGRPQSIVPAAYKQQRNKGNANSARLWDRHLFMRDPHFLALQPADQIEKSAGKALPNEPPMQVLDWDTARIPPNACSRMAVVDVSSIRESRCHIYYIPTILASKSRPLV